MSKVTLLLFVSIIMVVIYHPLTEPQRLTPARFTPHLTAYPTPTLAGEQIYLPVIKRGR